MNMKLSYRDKVIFIVVIVLIVLAVGFFVFVKAKIQESKDMQANLEVKQEELDEVHAKIDTLEPLKQQLKNDIKEVDELQAPFMDEQLTFEADQYIYEILSGIPDVKILSMTLTGEDAGALSPYYYQRNTLAYDLKMNSDLTGDSLDQDVYDKYYNTFPAAPENAIVAVDTIELEIAIPIKDNQPDWDTAMAIVDAFADHEKTLYLSSFGGAESLVEDPETKEPISSTIKITVNVYSVYKMDTSKVDS